MTEQIYFKCDVNKQSILSNFEARGLERATGDEWSIYWATVSSTKSIFHPENRFRFSDRQIINHFSNNYALCRKDLMVRHIKRYRKELERENNPLGMRDAFGKYTLLDLIPPTYILPNEMALFEEHFRREPSTLWIMKPPARAQGAGVFIVSKMSQLQKWSQKWSSATTVSTRDSYLISKYIDNPLLISERKFDLRLYVLVTSYRPLRAFLYKQGFCRFCVEKYSNNVSELGNSVRHLSNIAIQKHADNYNEVNGSKWSVEDLRLHLEAIYGYRATTNCFDRIEFIIIHSLKSVQNVISNDKHCFECYGFDVMIDDQLKPWLIEVNASPSLSSTTQADRVLKNSLLNDVFNIVMPNNDPTAHTRGNIPISDLELGEFVPILDEKPTRR
ncbi:hypothetical protein PCE1_001177 [Barthelona sp. PCE]